MATVWHIGDRVRIKLTSDIGVVTNVRTSFWRTEWVTVDFGNGNVQELASFKIERAR